MYKNELRMSRNVDKQQPGSMLQACRHRENGLVVFVHAPDAPHCPPVGVLEEAWCFRLHGTLRRRICCRMCWNLWQRSWIFVHHDGLCSVLFNYVVWLAQTVSK